MSIERPSHMDDGFSNFVGQEAIVARLRAMGDLYSKRSSVPNHVLLTGPAGAGKATLAIRFSETYGHRLRDVGADEFEFIGDVTETLTNLDSGDVLLIRNIHDLPQKLAKVLSESARSFKLRITIGRGASERRHTLDLKHFCVLGTAPRDADCGEEVLSIFDMRFAFTPYSTEQMERIARMLSTNSGTALSLEVARMIAAAAEGSPARLMKLLAQLSRLIAGPITEESAREVLKAIGARVGTSGSTPPGEDLNILSGVQFEALIRSLLGGMGFRTEMTKATGDGGIDIVAFLDTPIVGGRYLVQCKRFGDTQVGASAVRDFYGAVVADLRATKGVFITTSGFTAQARDFAESVGVELIDGTQLKVLLCDARKDEQKRSV